MKVNVPTYRYVVFWQSVEDDRERQGWVVASDVLTAVERFKELHAKSESPVQSINAIRRDGTAGWNSN